MCVSSLQRICRFVKAAFQSSPGPRFSLVGGWPVSGFCLVGGLESWLAFRDGNMLAQLILLMVQKSCTS